MTRSRSNRAGDALPPGVQITFREDVTQPELRRAAERSVATLMSRAAEAVAEARAAEAARAEAVAALNTPFLKLIEADAAAAQALEKLSAQQLFDVHTVSGVQIEEPYAPGEVGFTLVRPGPLRVWVPPYDFSWSFSNGNPPFAQLFNAQTGRVGLDARSGLLPGGASGFVEAHAGYGVNITTGRTVQATGRSFRRMRHSFVARAVGVGANATSEGGMELAAFEDGQLIASARHSLWRGRVSASFSSGWDESASEQEGPFAVYEPSELVFTMSPGHQYTFEVGIWVFTDRSTGVGAGAVQSLLQGNVLAISVERP